MAPGHEVPAGGEAVRPTRPHLPPPPQPAWDSTDYARDCQYLGQPRESPAVVTVREWFRKDRASMWQSADHPAHDIAGHLDVLAAAICTGNREVETIGVMIFFSRRRTPTLYEQYYRSPLNYGEPIYDPSQRAERDHARERAADALEALLRAAWSLEDREKYDQTYAMLRRTKSEMVWWRRQTFGGAE